MIRESCPPHGADYSIRGEGGQCVMDRSVFVLSFLLQSGKDVPGLGIRRQRRFAGGVWGCNAHTVPLWGPLGVHLDKLKRRNPMLTRAYTLKR